MKFLILFIIIFGESTWAGPFYSDSLHAFNRDSILENSKQKQYFQECIISYVLSNKENNSNYIYHAANSIITGNDYIVTSDNNELVLKAGNVIVLEPDSVISEGSLFLAKIEPCIPCALNFTYPKFFTPNSDNYNDTWTINWNNISEFTGVSIFDRYGKLLKVLNNPSESWSGTLNARNLYSDDYWFTLEYTDCNGQPRIYRSHFSLIR